MAVRFDAGGDFLTRTTSVLNANAAYTWMAWCYRIGTGSFQSVYQAATASGSNYDGLYAAAVGANDLSMYVNDVAGDGGTLNANTWTHLAIVRSSTTLITLYVNGASAATNTTNVGARGTITRMGEAADLVYGTGFSFNGRIAYAKAWSAALSVGEVQSEMQLAYPARLANLYDCWLHRPGATERLFGLNGLAWTANGTLTDEDDPPIVISCYRARAFRVTAAGATTFTKLVGGSGPGMRLAGYGGLVS